MKECPEHLLAWDKAFPILPTDNIVSSEYAGGARGKKEMFYPTYSYERRPEIYKLVTFEYARIWQEERSLWASDKTRGDPILIRKEQWKRRYDEARKAEMKRRAAVKRKQEAETKLKLKQKAEQTKTMLEAKAESLKQRIEAEAQEKERKKLVADAQKKRSEKFEQQLRQKFQERVGRKLAVLNQLIIEGSNQSAEKGCECDQNDGQNEENSKCP